MSRTFIAIESDAISFVVWWRAWVREYLFRIRYTSKKKIHKISLNFFKPKKKPALAFKQAYYCTIQYRAFKRRDDDDDDDAARFILFVIILRVNFILIFYHSFIFIDFFCSSFFNENINIHNKNSNTTNLVVVVGKIK